jgi:hypothetical protein
MGRGSNPRVLAEHEHHKALPAIRGAMSSRSAHGDGLPAQSFLVEMAQAWRRLAEHATTDIDQADNRAADPDRGD